MTIITSLAEIDWYAFVGMPQVIFLVGGPIAIVSVICWAWKNIEVTKTQARLKSEMLERGMSTEGNRARGEQWPGTLTQPR